MIKKNKKIIGIILIASILGVVGCSSYFLNKKTESNQSEIKIVQEEVLLTEGLQKDPVPIIWHTVGPLEPNNMYPEIQPNNITSEEVRMKLNTTFKEATFSSSCLYSDEITKDDLIGTLQANAVYDTNSKKKISGIDLKKLSMDEIRQLYKEIKKPESYSVYTITKNKGGLLSGNVGSSSSYCGWEAHPGHSLITFTIDLASGKEVTLGNIFTIDSTFVDVVRQKINEEYRTNGAQDPDNVCWQFINNKYLFSDDTWFDGEAILKKETSFSVSSSTFRIIPTGYTSDVEDAMCEGTSIDFSNKELFPYLKKGTLMERLQ